MEDEKKSRMIFSHCSKYLTEIMVSRPHKKNALSLGMLDQLTEALMWWDKNPS